MKKTIAIVGGGPAGLSSAILLARQGWEITLFERKSYPHNKVCGEFMSAESLPLLEKLGVIEQIEATRPGRITEILIADSKGRFILGKLPTILNDGRCAFGLSRERFDTILYTQAKKVGVKIKTGHSVQEVRREGSEIIIESMDMSTQKSESATFSMAIVGSGRQRNSIHPKPGKSYYGIKAHYENVDEVGERVELHSYSQGYIGLANIQDNLTNLCYIVEQKKLNECKGDLDLLTGNILDGMPVLGRRFRNAKRMGQWYSFGPLESGFKKFYEDGVFYVGDACGAIEPLSGDGITMAMASSFILSGCLEGVVNRDVSLEELGREYAGKVRRLFSSPIRLGKVLGYFATHPARSSQFIQILGLRESLLNFFINRTRIVLPV